MAKIVWSKVARMFILIGNFFEAAVERHQAVRRMLLLWIVIMLTIILLRVTDPAVIEKVNSAVATIVTATVSIFTAVIGIYNWSRYKETNGTKENSVDD